MADDRESQRDQRVFSFFNALLASAIGGFVFLVWILHGQLTDARIDIARLQEQVKDCK